MEKKRFRVLDNSVYHTGQPTFDYFTAGGGCGTAPQWYNNFKLTPVSIYSGTIATMDDFVSDRFLSRRKAGEIIINPMHRASITVNATGGSITPEVEDVNVTCGSSSAPFHMKDRRYVPNVPSALWSSGLYHNGPPLMSIPRFGSNLNGNDVRDLLTEVSTCVLNKRGRPQNGSNLWETMAEAHKLASLLPGLLQNAASLVNKNSKGMRRAGSASSGWLATRYGLMPIISDIKGIVEGIAKTVGSVRETSRCIGSLSTSKTTYLNGQMWLPYSTYGSPHLFDAVSTDIESFEIRAMSIDALEASMLYNVGFSTKGLVTLPWELVNKSFVADWFVNIGDFLGALVPAFGFHNLGMCYVVRGVKTTNYHVVRSFTTSNYTVVTPMSGSASRIWQYTTRAPGLPAKPGIVLKHDFRFDHIVRSLDAISLLVNGIRRFR